MLGVLVDALFLFFGWSHIVSSKCQWPERRYQGTINSSQSTAARTVHCNWQRHRTAGCAQGCCVLHYTAYSLRTCGWALALHQQGPPMETAKQNRPGSPQCPRRLRSPMATQNAHPACIRKKITQTCTLPGKLMGWRGQRSLPRRKSSWTRARPAIRLRGTYATSRVAASNAYCR